MKNGKKLLSLLLCATLTGTLFAGCGGEKKTSSEKNEATGNMLTVTIASEPETIDPTLNSSMDGATYILHTFEGLMRYEPTSDGGAEAEPGMAESYDVSDDQKTYTFHIRENAKWSDGKDVTANDFVYAWRRLVNPKTAADYATYINCVENAEDIVAGDKKPEELGVEAVDEKTFVVHLVAPTAYFASLTAGAQLVPLREDIVEGNEKWTFEPKTYVSNGPYKMTSWTHDQSIVMKVNEYYYDKDKMKNEGIVWKLMADDNSILAGFQGKELDMINQVPVDETKSLLDDGTLVTVPQLGTYCVVFNVEKEPFDDPKVREAFSLAIDRNYIAENVVQTGVEPAGAWVPSGIDNGAGGDFRKDGGDYYSVKAEDYEANCKKAKALMEEAGYPDGKGFPVVEYLYNTMDSHQKIFEALGNMWSSVLGVTVNGSNQDWNVFLSTRETGDFQIARHGWVADFNDALNFLDMYTTSNIDGNNYPRWSNKDYDKAISDSIKEGDAAKRQKLLHKAEDLMMKDNIVAPLYFYMDKYCLQDGITGMYHTPLGYFFFKYCSKN
ncbi:oligopeptide transport system substrate-binding protein [Lachnospiraceae bacterium XBB1006]|nr:oligopeptide transport system substrate-binding protein [Lachnospiraceae bacterium XBB1006]